MPKTNSFYQTLAFHVLLPLIAFVALLIEAMVFLWIGAPFARVFVFLGITTLAFLIYILYTLRKQLFIPFREIAKQLAEIRDGNYTYRSHVTAHNEFAQYAETLNVVAEKLGDENSQSIEKLQRVISDLNNSTKMLIQRDLELSRANEKLRDLDKMKSEFVSLATHQLRTPLSGVRWSLSMLLNGEMGDLTPEQKLYVMKTYESNNRMITLINDMLQADRVEGGTLKFKFTPTNLTYLVENVLTELKQIAERRKVQIHTTIDEQLPLLMVDPENMRMVLQNLIDNAIKYSKEGGDVYVTIAKKEGLVEMIIQDHGIGIPQAHQINIFKRFFRAPNAVHTETDGSGLGLYIVESIIQRHRGTIRFESKENEGTTFYVTLPITLNA